MKYKKAMFSLPETLLRELDSYSRVTNEGNKSGFVSDAIAQRIEWLRKARYTMNMREAYRASAARNRKILEEWKDVDAEAWRKLDQLDELS